VEDGLYKRIILPIVHNALACSVHGLLCSWVGVFAGSRVSPGVTAAPFCAAGESSDVRAASFSCAVLSHFPFCSTHTLTRIVRQWRMV